MKIIDIVGAEPNERVNKPLVAGVPLRGPAWYNLLNHSVNVICLTLPERRS
jgi:hypothetical protein